MIGQSYPHSDTGPITLVAMPWAMPRHPSIQIGLLHALLLQHGINVVSRSLFIEFVEYVVARSSAGRAFVLTVDDYEKLGAHHHLGEWVFSGPPLVENEWTSDAYLVHLRQAGFSPHLVEIAREIRRYVPGFLDEIVVSLLNPRPAAIGFTTTFGQTIPSLQLALRIKSISPTTRIVFGGANCEGKMGEALFDSFDCVDFVVQGEGENVALEIFGSIARGEPVRSCEGVLSRERITCPPSEARKRLGFFDLNSCPVPNYDEYFAYVQSSSLRDTLSSKIFIPIETSRGCWWGMKAHCTFCGLNGDTMSYRSKDPKRVAAEFIQLSQGYRVLNFAAVDNIMDHNYFSTALPLLEATGIDFRIFFEVKANLTKNQIRSLREARILDIQPGIESLSTPILRLMRKGTSALKNIRLLKWCSEFDVGVHWNLIFGFPGEDPAEYDRMAKLIPSLVHLSPPNISSLGIERFSPYHSHPERYGLRILGPTPFYRYAYPLSEDALRDLAYTFDYEYVDGRQPSQYSASLQSAVMKWNTVFSTTGRSLSYRRGRDFMIVQDRRFDETREIVLDRRDAAIYEACDEGATLERIQQKLRALDKHYSLEEITTALSDMDAAHLLYSENGEFLALAPSANLNDGRESWTG